MGCKESNQTKQNVPEFEKRPMSNILNYLLNYKVNPQLLIQDFSHANKMLNKAAVNAGSNEMLTFSMGHPEGVTTKKKYFPL